MMRQMIDGVFVYGQPDPEAIKQILNCKKDAYFCALMADHHLGYAVPIGGVVAYENKISPSGVGYDIGCGNKAVLLDFPAKDLRANIKTIMDDIWKNISFGVGRTNNEKVDHEIFENDVWNLNPALRPLKDLARAQLGTIGSGNHYVDLFIDEQDRVWCGVHFGSRGLGHKTATYYLKAAGGKDGIMVDPVVLDLDEELGELYLYAMNLCGDYANAGRTWVCNKVASILGANIIESIHNHHNFAWREQHEGKDLYVVRKGSTPNFPGQKSFVGGSMGDISVIIEGTDTDSNKESFYSTVHGAGRVLGRKQAKRELTQEMLNDWMKGLSVELRGSGLDEAPQCYKRLPDVLSNQGETIKILHTLTPVGVAMAGSNERDPYKD